MMIEIHPAEFPRDLAEVRSLFREYANGLGIDLHFQGFEAEVAELPGKYAVPQGRLLLAWSGTQAVGCVALRPLKDTSFLVETGRGPCDAPGKRRDVSGARCEMKRLYVRPRARGEQLGRQLAQRVCDEARQAGYLQICLDTLPTMASAQKLYRSLGFAPIEPYVFNPIPETKFLALDLRMP